MHYKNVPSILFQRHSALWYLAIAKIEKFLKGHRFAEIPYFREHVTKVLKHILNNVFQECFVKWCHPFPKLTAFNNEQVKKNKKKTNYDFVGIFREINNQNS